ncbi:hypothetical protein ILYODFUR_033161 [Ilyodon furcidens]|uniref:Secreted protein n=1 Tax=Ilyodon furcidens TaxID=33524 RepID=A0ABV0SR65_9TELE
MWCVCVVAGSVVGDDGPGCLLLTSCQVSLSHLGVGVGGDSPLLFCGGEGFRCLWLGSPQVSVPGPGGQVCGSSHSLLHIFMEKPYIHKHTHTQSHKCLDSGVNRYTNFLY